MSPYIFIILLIQIYPINCLEKALEIKFLNDYLNVEKSKVYVSALLCWNTDDKIYLSNTLTDNNFRIIFYEENITHIPEILPLHYSLYVLDSECDNSRKILEMAHNDNLFQFPRSWLIFTYRDNLTYFDDLNILADSNFLVAQKNENNFYELYAIYVLKTVENQYLRNSIALWNEDNGFDKVPLKNFWQERKDIKGTLLRSTIVILHNETMNHLTDYRDKHIDAVSKLNYIIVTILVDYLNGSKDFIFVDNWGYIAPNKSYTGMIGFLERNESEIGGTPLFITADRIPVIDYIAMTTPTRLKFMFRQPPLSYVSNVFMLPFTTPVWLCSIALIILVTFLQYIVVHLEWRFLRIALTEMTLKDSFSESVMVTVGSICQQGAPEEPKSTSGQMVMLFGLISLMFLYVSYSANIVALLQSPATNIQTLEDLLVSRLELGVDDTVYNRYYFEHATETTRKAIYEKKVAPKGEHPHFYDFVEGVEKVHRGLYAFHMEQAAFYKLVGDTFLETEKCGLQEIGGYIEVVDPWMSIRKNSTFKELMKIGYRKLQESGVQTREYDLLYTKKPACHTGGNNFISVGLIDCYGAFELLAFGIALSLLSLLFEIVLFKYLQKRKTNQ